MRYLLLCLVLSASTACIGFETVTEELQRIPSPNRRFDAVLIRKNCGAPCQFEYDAYIVPPGASWKGQDQVFHAASAEDLKLVWADSATLDVDLRCGRITAFNNFFWPPDGPPAIEVRLRLPPASSALCKVDQHFKRGTRGA
jgi:hypothetical protein